MRLLRAAVSKEGTEPEDRGSTQVRSDCKWTGPEAQLSATDREVVRDL